MRFLNYLRLVEKSEKYTANAKEIRDAAKRAAKKAGISSNKVIFIGAQDMDNFGIMFYFNINAPKHERHQSTIVDIRKG